MPKKAYSYIRFSREHQSQGDSLRRQLEATRSYCERNNLLLDESLELCDLGISAFKGRNSSKGSLGRFIDLCERGEISPGSALVVESLDRISRQSPRRAVALLSTLLDLGIELHLTMAGKVFRPAKEGEDGSQEGIDLIMAVAMAMRAHEESETKSRRLREAFQKKRQRAGEGQGHVSKTVPWWLSLDGDKIVAVPERAKIVKRIYQLTAKGWSSQKIARALNSEGIPTWRPRAKEWQDSRIRDTIRFDAALGHLCPTPKTKAAGLQYRLENYYPRIVSDDLAAEARAAMRQNLVIGTIRESKVGRPQNLFRGLLRHKGRWCRFQSHQNGLPDEKGIKGWHGYYDDHDPNQSGKKTWSIAATQLEPVVVHCLRELSPADLLPENPKTPHRSVKLRAQVHELERKIANLVDAIAGGAGKALTSKLTELEATLVDKRRELLRTEAVEAPKTDSGSLLRSLSLNLNDPTTRTRTVQALRRLVTRIDVGASFEDFENVMSKELYGAWIDKNINIGEPSTIVADPVPRNKRRKEILIMITFRSGATRIISRLTGSDEDNVLYTARIDLSGAAA